MIEKQYWYASILSGGGDEYDEYYEKTVLQFKHGLANGNAFSSLSIDLNQQSANYEMFFPDEPIIDRYLAIFHASSALFT